MAFEVRNPDRGLSPKTGMARRHWLDAGAWLLEGVLRHVKRFDDPIVLPNPPGKTYPQPGDPEWKFRAAEFEGLARTFMVAAPVLAERPDLEAAGKRVRDYYANQVLLATDPKSPRYFGKITDMIKKYGTPLYQHTAEGAALALGLQWSRTVIWDRFSRAEKDRVAELLHDYTHNRTNAHNWRSFNLTMGTFLRLNGYPVDEGLMLDHLQGLLAYHAGQGWYRDLGSFDFYSAWAFQFYLPIWAAAWGYDHEAEAAAAVERRHAELMKTYPLMFGRDGRSLMWGRSIIYRCAASAALASAFLLRQTPMDPGWARRIASGNLLQFLGREDAFADGVPTLGFYRAFGPCVQGYSAAASPFWLAKIFLALALPSDSPFWTAREHDGVWRRLGRCQKTVALDGPGLAITAHGPSGAAELRPGKVNSKASEPNYTRLAYNTAFPWEADSPQGATAMAYSLREYVPAAKEFFAHTNLRYAGLRGGVLYRSTDLRGWMARMDLADILVPGGVLRVDRLRIPQCHELRLGHFGLPHLAGRPAVVERIEAGGRPAITAAIAGRRLALVAYRGWDGLDAAVHAGLNAEADESTVLFARRAREKDSTGTDLVVALMLHRTDDGPWTPEELDPVGAMEVVPWTASGQPCGLRLDLRDGRRLVIDFEDIEGQAGT